VTPRLDAKEQKGKKPAVGEIERPGFFYRQHRQGLLRRVSERVLYCEELPLQKLVEKYGTPLYVYSSAAILERLAEFEAAFRGIPHTICYSVKANSNLTILRLLARKGCGFDVVSGGELERVIVASGASRQVVFSGVGKSREEMTAAIKAGILLFNVESESELRTLAECAERLRKTARIALRVNPDVAAETHPYISTGLRKHKFGVPIREARELYAQARKYRNLQVAGVSVHIGSQITDISPFAEAVERVADLIGELRQDGHKIDFVDIGGGLGIDYQDGGAAFSDCVVHYAKAVMHPLRRLKVHLLLEPGRAIVGSAGVLVTSVVYRKENDGKQFLVVDAGMNDLIRPSLYGAHHEIVPATVPVRSNVKPTKEIVDVVGPVCESGDFFAKDRDLPRVEQGGLLSVLDAGAYGMSLASNYNSRPRPAEVLVRGKSAKLIRRREKLPELYAAELEINDR
jgi:diaminopimelate decarboxylase